ncbi:NAD(P)-dependent oxidoreductase [Polaromonas sp.]|uniref:NAD-dependent epimerase/dehydratase family protein n=1 Tax=Polaromonas sp. TaxID=1869339 RepID=UPI003266AE44
MRVLVLGATGHIGRRMMEVLRATSWSAPVGASRSQVSAVSSPDAMTLDTRNVPALTSVLKRFDAVVNCVAGDAASISGGAEALVQAGLAGGCPRIIHLSTMSVYGPAEGELREDAALDPALGWYGRAKCEAEAHLAAYARQGGEAVILRPGCVFGPGSELWVGRTGRWLHSGRLGDLGAAGDGWSNLVHVDDVCQALVAALRLPVAPGQSPAFNLAAPDSPRWNDFFVDLALALDATPVRRISRRQLQLDAWLAGPPLKLAQLLLKRLGKEQTALPSPMPPGLLRLWTQHIHLDASLATQTLGLTWTPYPEGLQSSAAWFSGKYSSSGKMMGKPLWMH